jgi:ParB-like chromosome segregation protein Spo0J
MADLKVHPAAAVFPMLSDDELADLAEDIKANGLLHPIVLDADGALIDGRNRLAACEIAGVEPTWTTLADDVDPVAVILSENIKRRHMTAGQRAMAVAVVSDLSQITTRRLAGPADVSQSRIAYALVVREHAPDLVENVLAAGMTLDAAYTEARTRKDAATSMAAQMGMLRIEAPDLASLVAEERVPLREALALLDKRRADARRRKEAATAGLLSAVRFLARRRGMWSSTPIASWPISIRRSCRAPRVSRRRPSSGPSRSWKSCSSGLTSGRRVVAARKRSPFHRDIDEQVEATFHARTNADGELDLEDVIGDLTAWFVGHPRVLQEEARRVATALARQFDEGRRPRPSAKVSGGFQAGLFQPHFLIPYGANKRVWMEQATREQFAAWMGVRASEWAVRTAAEAVVAQYQSQRWTVWTPSDDTLIDVERRYFGWLDDADAAKAAP